MTLAFDFDPRPVKDPGATRAAAQDGMDRAEAHAAPDWQDAALDAIRAVARRQVFLTVDDVWEELDGSPATTHDGSALGPVMVAARKAGVIRPAGRFVKSERPSTHGRPVNVWQSRLREEG